MSTGEEERKIRIFITFGTVERERDGGEMNQESCVVGSSAYALTDAGTRIDTHVQMARYAYKRMSASSVWYTVHRLVQHVFVNIHIFLVLFCAHNVVGCNDSQS